MRKEQQQGRRDSAPITTHVLDAATPLPDLDPSALNALVGVLAEQGKLIVVERDPATGRTTFYQRDEWIR